MFEARNPIRRATGRSRRRSAAVVALAALAALGTVGASACGQDGGDGGAQDGGAGGEAAPETTTTTLPAPDALDDGEHEVLVESVNRSGGRATVDGVLVLSGTDAVLAYLADTDGAQLEGAQFYVRNARTAPRELPVDRTGTFSVIPAEACCDPVEVGWDEFATEATTDFAGLWGRNPPFAATIEDGTITSLVQVYVP